MNFCEKNLVKRLSICSLIAVMCVLLVGITSLATYVIPEDSQLSGIIALSHVEGEGNGENVPQTFKLNIKERFNGGLTGTSGSIVEGKSYCYEFTIREGYEAIIESNIDIIVDMEAGTICIPYIDRDVEIIITYERVVEKTTYAITIITQYLDGLQTGESRSYDVVEGERFDASYHIIEGYEFSSATVSAGNAVIDSEAQTIYIENVNSDCTITIYLSKQIVSVEYNITVITKYLDGFQEDESRSYDVLEGESFETSYSVTQGYQFSSATVSAGNVVIDSETQIISIERVDSDCVITIYLEKEDEETKYDYNITIKTVYIDGMLPDATTVYGINHGEDFAEAYEALHGYMLAGASIRSADVFVDGGSQMIYINNVTRDYLVTIYLEPCNCHVGGDYTVTITVKYPEGTVANQVYTYRVFDGESFEETFDIEDGYEPVEVILETGMNVQLWSSTIYIESVTKDMSAIIICE